MQIVASREEIEREIEATTPPEEFNNGSEIFNQPSDDEKLEVQTEISATNTPEDFSTGEGVSQ